MEETVSFFPSFSESHTLRVCSFYKACVMINKQEKRH